MNKKEPKEPKGLKLVPRYTTMATVHTNLFAKVPHPCLSCKNSIDLPCEGCEHNEAKNRALQKHRTLIDMTLKAKPTQRDAIHRVIEAIMNKQHQLEQLHDGEDFMSVDRHRAGVIEGLGLAIELAREALGDGDAQEHK